MYINYLNLALIININKYSINIKNLFIKYSKRVIFFEGLHLIKCVKGA